MSNAESIRYRSHGDTGKSFYHVDGLGSTRALSDALGIVTDRYIYDAYGNTIIAPDAGPDSEA